MHAPSKNWGQLVAGVLFVLLGAKALIRGSVRHWLIPEYGVSGTAAKVVGILCLVMGSIIVIDWLRKHRLGDRK
jgi:hypothetical protein